MIAFRLESKRKFLKFFPEINIMIWLNHGSEFLIEKAFDNISKRHSNDVIEFKFKFVFSISNCGLSSQ